MRGSTSQRYLGNYLVHGEVQMDDLARIMPAWAVVDEAADRRQAGHLREAVHPDFLAAVLGDLFDSHLQAHHHHGFLSSALFKNTAVS